MLKKRIGKIAFVLACIITMIMPYTSTVLAAALTHETGKTAELQVLIFHEGGEESGNILNDAQKEFYDKSPYGYTLGNDPTKPGTRVYKIIEKGDTGYTNTFYCLDAEKSFPGVTGTNLNSLEYTNVADLKNATDTNVKALHLGTSYAEDQALWTANYKSLIWLINNMYLEKQAHEQKNDYLTKAFADYEGSDIEVVKAFLTDDDIDVVQQYAIWYFTNGNNIKYNTNTLPTVTLTKMNMDRTTVDGSYNDLTGQAERQLMANHLFRYLVENAKKAEETAVTYPQVAETTAGANLLDDTGYYVVGPFKMTSGTAAKTEYSLKLLDQNDNEINRNEYKIYIEGEEGFTDKNVDEIFDAQYYIYLPKTNKTITKINLKIDYLSFDTNASLWKNTTTDDTGKEVYQPVVLITRGDIPHSDNKDYEIDRKTADLSLRKHIIKVNDKAVDRSPKVDVTGLKAEETTAVYKHAKDPVKVSNGDTIVYEIRVYNEADIEARGTVIIDALPKGLEFVEDSPINTTYDWEKVTEGNNVVTYKTEYLRNTTIAAFDKNTDGLSSEAVQIECKVSDAARASSVLTNVAEIQADEIEDRDSAPENNDYLKNDYDSSNYTGNNENKEDLADADYYYKGREDDDDFEKVIVEGKTFDLSLQKFITKINKNAPATNREPVVDVTNLKNGTSTNATYKTTKTPLVVKKGDIVTYTIRVYNEGETAGYAEEVADYLPEGLGFLVGHTTNVDNFWSIPEGAESVKLSTIPNGTTNLSVDDFNNIKKLDDVVVVKGKVKITSTKLKSSDTDEKNLIDGFDREKDTALGYRDIQVTCIVLADEVVNNNCRNIAEITKHSDKNKEEITDQDSVPNTVNPDQYPGNDENQDDHDYENLATDKREFDLSLQKFITKLNNDKITGREPSVVVSSEGKIQFSAPSTAKDPLHVKNGDTVVYTIRVYNEGNMSGYAQEVSDDLPAGLEFLTDHEVNKKYGWELYDKNGNKTTDLSQAVKVKTDYLSKNKSESRNQNCLLDAFDKATDKTPDYRDVEIAFKVVENKISSKTQRTIINTAEITNDADKDGNSVDDVDSTPNNNKSDEDDIDQEKVYVKYFDLSLQKDLVKIIITEDGTTKEVLLGKDAGLQKVEIHRKKIDKTTVKFVYDITVKNEGEIAGYATEITDYIPEGLEFIAEENTAWTKVTDREIKTSALSNTLLEPGKTAKVQVVLKWINDENNFGTKVNIAEISADKNDSNTPDIDSTPNNKVDGEDDIDKAEVMLAISTGTAPTYVMLALTVSIIMVTGIALIKKYVLI